MEKRRVVITGMGTVNPIGNSVAESWQAAKDGKCGIGPITRYDCSNMRVKLAGEVKDLDIDGILGKREAKKMDRFTQFALIAAQQAMDDSGLDREREDLSRCGVICSSGIGGFETVGGAFLRGESRGYDSVSPFMIPMIISNMAAGQIAIRFGFQGMCTCVVTACAGGTNAVGDAFRHIRDGYGDVMLCGGAEAAITPLAMGGFTAMKALCESTDPARASIPFDAERSGFVMGEGAGMLVLEEYEHAVKRGAKIYGEVCGYGATCDAFHITAPRPDGSAGARAIQLALQEAGHQAGERVYINAHGTGTPMNDSLETQVVKLALGEEEAKKAYMSSTKSMTGHMLGAAGAIEALACLKALNEGVLPPTINLLDPDPACDLNYVPNQAIHTEVDLVLSNSLGFGGHNACIAFRKVTR